MKKLSLLFYIFIATVLSVWIHGEILMRVILPQQSTQRFIEQQVQEILNRPVRIGHVGLCWRGLILENVRTESKQPSEEKSFLSVKRAQALWSLRSLLKGKIKFYTLRIEKPTFHLLRYEDGSLSIADFANQQTPSAEEQQTETETNSPVDIQIEYLTLTDGEILFTDLQNKQQIEIAKLYVGTKKMQLSHSFPVMMNAHISYTQADKAAQLFKIGLVSKVDLQNLDREKIHLQIKSLLLSHAGGKFKLKANLRNAVAPYIHAELTASDLSEKLITWLLPQATSFSVPKLQIKTDMAAELSDNRITVSSFNLQTLDSVISAQGSGIFSQTPSFDAQGNFDLNLRNIGQAVGILQSYRLDGKLRGSAQGTQDNFSANISLQKAAATAPNIGNLSDMNFNLIIPDKDHASLPDLIGKINDGEFTAGLTLQHSQRGIELDIKANAPRIALPPLAQKEDAVQNPAVPTLPEKAEESSKIPPFYIKAAIDVNSLDAPFLYGENIVFRADLNHLTPALNKTQGTLSLNIGQGEIKDLAQLTNANILTGVLFGSLDVVGRVINSLNVLSVLNVFSDDEEQKDRSEDMVVQTIMDENGQEQHILVPYEAGAYGDIWKFKSFATDMSFENGVGDIKQGLFRSDRMSFNLTGDMNFNTRELDMTVQAAPGLHDTGGVMPLTVDIDGTIEEPQGSMRMVSSVASMLTQSMTNNFASRTVKKSVGGFFGLFKKKSSEEDNNEKEGTTKVQ